MSLKEAMNAYVQGLDEASDLFVDIDPDYIIAPMMGSVPFIDVMHIVNPDFDVEKVNYMPASSQISDVNKVMTGWMSNFLDDVVTPENPIKIMGIDEVVSGSSATRVYRAINGEINNKKKRLTSEVLSKFYTADNDEFENAVKYFDSLSDSKYFAFLSTLAKEQRTGRYLNDDNLLITRQNQLADIVRTYFDKSIQYQGIGIEDSKIEVDSNKKRNKAYKEIRATGGIIPVSVKAILTMDKPHLCPAKYEQVEAKDPRKYTKFSPRVSGFEVTKSYVNFLTEVARISGKNPNNVHPVNMKKILDSSKYLPEEYLAKTIDTTN